MVFILELSIVLRSLDKTSTCPISAMNDFVEVVEWADKMVMF